MECFEVDHCVPPGREAIGRVSLTSGTTASVGRIALRNTGRYVKENDTRVLEPSTNHSFPNLALFFISQVDCSIAFLNEVAFTTV